ncbi:MAG TPA: hypothetical protein VIX82_11805 [Solirubrobacteraceae bacterium]
MSSKWRAAVGALCVAVGLATGGSALAAGDSVVVPPGGTVAGMGYGGWLALSWQLAFRAHAPGPGACETAFTTDGPVAVLFQSFAGGQQAYTCHEPLGRPIYVVGISSECSTVPGDHGAFGDTPAQLEKCAPAGFDGAFGTASVDGRPVENYRALISRTTVFTFHLPKHNIFDTTERAGRSAAYGEGLLLRGLSSGAHIIQTTSVVPNVFSAEVTYTLHIG